MNERRLNSLKHEDRSRWQRRKTRQQWLMWPSTQRIGKDIRASSKLFTRWGVDVVSEACFTAMTGDRHYEPAAMDLSMISVALAPSWLVWILTVRPVWLYFSSFMFCSVLFLTDKTLHTIGLFGCAWFLLPNWDWKPLKLGLSILFSLRIFVSVHVLIT